MPTLNRDWRTILRHYSSIAFALLGSFHALWVVSPEVQALFPPVWVAGISLFLTVAGFVGKFIKQNLESPRV